MSKCGVLVLCCACVAILCYVSGCQTTVGHMVPNSQFAYPNSNVKMLGPVKAEITKTSWLIAPDLKIADLRKCYNDAMSKASGANILVNYRESTTLTIYPIIFVSSVKYTLEGDAAQMDVGKQQLK